MMTHTEALSREMEVLGRKATQEEYNKALEMDRRYGPITATAEEEQQRIDMIIASSLERFKKVVDKYATI